MALHAARVIRQRHKADEEPPSDITPGQRKNLEDAFEAADKNGDGVLTADEYFEIFQTHGLTIGKHYLLSYFLGIVTLKRNITKPELLRSSALTFMKSVNAKDILYIH